MRQEKSVESAFPARMQHNFGGQGKKTKGKKWNENSSKTIVGETSGCNYEER